MTGSSLSEDEFSELKCSVMRGVLDGIQVVQGEPNSEADVDSTLFDVTPDADGRLTKYAKYLAIGYKDAKSQCCTTIETCYEIYNMLYPDTSGPNMQLVRNITKIEEWVDLDSSDPFQMIAAWSLMRDALPDLLIDYQLVTAPEGRYIAILDCKLYVYEGGVLHEFKTIRELVGRVHFSMSSSGADNERFSS